MTYKEASSSSSIYYGNCEVSSSVPISVLDPLSFTPIPKIPKEQDEQNNAPRGFAFLLDNKAEKVKRKVAPGIPIINVDLTDDDDDVHENCPPKKRQKQGMAKNAYGQLLKTSNYCE